MTSPDAKEPHQGMFAYPDSEGEKDLFATDCVEMEFVKEEKLSKYSATKAKRAVKTI